MWNIYHAYVLTHLNYLSPIWSNTSNNKLHELQIIQNRVLRIINGTTRLTATNLLYSASILPLDKLIQYQIFLLIHKIKNNEIKHNFELTYRSDTHQHYTRRISHLNIPFSRTNYGQNSAINRGFIEFNNLPTVIKHEVSISKFKKLIRTYLCG